MLFIRNSEAESHDRFVASVLQEDTADLDDGTTDGYVFDSPADLEEIAMQRQAIWDLLKNLGSHLLREGVNLTKVSLPVKVFEPRSFLQRITDNWAYIDLLQSAVDATDPVTRMQYVVSTANEHCLACAVERTWQCLFISKIKQMTDCLHVLQVGFVIGGLRRQMSTLKPFNPILGETYQGVYSSGVRVHAEQISHHPPVSSWQVVDPDGKVCLLTFALPIISAQCATALLKGCPQLPSMDTAEEDCLVHMPHRVSVLR